MERRGKSVRTCVHVRHFPDLPGREITIEGTSLEKHCTTATTKKRSMEKYGFEKKRGESMEKIEIVSTGTKEKETAEKRPDLGQGREEKIVYMYMYVLAYMVVTFPTSQAERSQLKSPAVRNTAHHTQQQRKVRIKMGQKRERSFFVQKEIQSDTKVRRKKKSPILDTWGKSVHVHVLDSMVVTFPTFHAEISPLKA